MRSSRTAGKPRDLPRWVATALLCALAACSRPDPPALTESAESRLLKDDLAGAVLDAKSALQIDAEWAPARLVLGKALLAAGDPAGAATEVERARELGAADDDTVPLLAAALLAQGRHQQLISQYAALQLGKPGAQADLLVLLAIAQWSAGAPAAAQAALAAAVRQVPLHQAAQLQMARMAVAAGNSAAATATVQAVLARAPHSADALLLQGDLAALAAPNSAAAEQAYRQAVQLRPRLDIAHQRLTQLYLARQDLAAASAQAEAMAKALPGHPQADYLLGVVAYLRNDLDQARDRSQRALRNAGDHGPALYLAGLTHWRLGAKVQAEVLLTQASAALPDAPEPRRDLAALLSALGKGGPALAVLKPLLAASAPDAAVWRVAGQAHSLLGDFGAADAAFARAARLKPADASTRLERGRSLLARGAFDQGVLELEAASAADTQDPGAELALLAAHMARGDHAAAFKAAQALRLKQPASPVADHLGGQILLASGDTAGARKAFDAALTKDALFMPAIHSLAQLDVQANDLKAAAKRYEALLKREPRVIGFGGASSAMLAMASIVRLGGASRADAGEWVDRAVQTDPKDVDTWRRAIEHHRRSGDEAGALGRAQQAVAALPDEPDLLLELGNSLHAAGDLQQAQSVFDKLVRLQPLAAPARLRLAQVFIDLKKPDRAAAHIHKALELAPDWAPALRSNVALLLQDKQADAALALARKTQARLPTRAVGWQLEADVAQQRPDWKAAAKALQLAITKADGADAAVPLHQALLQAGDGAQAQQLQQQWLQAHPNHLDFHLHVAQRALAAADWPAAERHFRAALRLQPGAPLLLNNLAYVLVQRNDKAALALAEQAARGAPDLAPVLDTLALAHAGLQNLDQALHWQARAVALAPQVGHYRLQLARYHLAAGNKAKARDLLDHLQSLGAEFPAQDEVRRLLGQTQA